MDKDYDSIINERAQHVFDVMAPRTSDEDLVRLRDAFELAREAHAPQVRKTGEPYILHPIAVASIAAEELNLDVNSIIAAFLHDVVEDTRIRLRRFQPASAMTWHSLSTSLPRRRRRITT